MNPRIWIVDDNEHNREYARQVLVGSYEISLADSGQTLLDSLNGDTGLILLDLSMPDLDGWQVLERLRARDDTRAIPVVACTAHAMSGDRERALAAGFDGYLAKPFRPSELIDVVGSFVPPSDDGGGDDDGWDMDDVDWDEDAE